MPDPKSVVHLLSNHLAVIAGFVDLLIDECADDDQKRADLLEVQKAVQEAVALLPEVAGLARSRGGKEIDPAS